MALEHTHRALLRPWVRRLALVVSLGSLVFPVGGLGVDVCWLHATTGLPCPGCGMTRAVAAMSQGDFDVALGANPFVVFAWPLMLALGALALLNADQVERVAMRLDAVGPLLGRVALVVMVAFLGFGALRLTYFLVTRQPFP